jgi:hypothetical protein
MTHDHETESDAPAATVTPETNAAESVAGVGSHGVRALTGAAIAIVGVVAAANPESAVLRALHQAMPQIADAVPVLITACGAIVAAFSQPPRLQRRRTRDEDVHRSTRDESPGSCRPHWQGGYSCASIDRNASESYAMGCRRADSRDDDADLLDH